MRQILGFVASDLVRNGRNDRVVDRNWQLLEEIRKRSSGKENVLWELALIYTGPQRSVKSFESRLKSLGWSLRVIEGLPSVRNSISFSIDVDLSRSEMIYQRLQIMDAAAFIFQDTRGEGFYSIRAKRTGLAFEKTALLTALSGPTTWLLAADQQWSRNPFRDLRLSFLERYCCEHADGVFSLDLEIRHWCQRQLWTLSPIQISSSEFDLSELLDSISRRTSEKWRRGDLEPKVSVCVAHFNHGRFLPQALEALAASSYRNFEVLVVDDASTDGESLSIFSRLEELYRPRGWQFFKKENNEGPQATRNFAVQRSAGDLLIFADSDNVSSPEMIAGLARGIQISGADSLSCWFRAIPATEALGSATVVKPLGAALEFGWLSNVFGDTGFCIRRSTFEKLGGFRLGDVKGVEDWDLLARLASVGFQHDVYPKVLYDYRELPSSLSRTTDNDRKHRAILESYTEGCPPHIRRLFFEYLIPSHLQLSAREHRVAQMFRHMLEL